MIIEKGEKIKGESGGIVESFIGTEEEIYNIDCSRHLGETLDYKYYIKENFDELKQKIQELEYLKEFKPPIFDFIENIRINIQVHEHIVISLTA